MLRIFWLIAILSFTATDSYGQRIRDATEPPATLRRPKPVPKRKPQLSEVSECAKLISESQYSSPKAAVADVAGKGYDVLQETLMMPASDTHFYMCNLLRRGNMFVPDNVYVTSVHKTRLTMDSRYINSFEEYKIVTSKSYGAGLGASYEFVKPNEESAANSEDNSETERRRRTDMGQGTISGSFSGANNAVKHNFRKYGRHMLRTVVQYHAYTLTIDIDALHPALMRRLNKVFVALDSNDVNRARREVGLIVRDFGTHVVISSEIGAEYVLEDHIDVDESQDITEAIDGLRFDGRLSALGRLAKHFGSIPGISGFYSSNPEVQNFTKYESNIRKMRFDSSGYIDPPSRANANDESEGPTEIEYVDLRNQLAPLTDFITREYVPGVPELKLQKTRTLINDVMRTYYRKNTVYGCTDERAENYNFYANINDGSCVDAEDYSYVFGGVYQECLNMNPNNMDLSIYACGHYSQSNIATGGTTCPTGFEAIPLFTTKHMLSEVTEYQDADCSRFYGLFTCDDSWWQTIHNVRVKLTASFCRSPKENSAANANRVLVGGYYHEHVHNLVTGHFGCPPGFQAHIVATSVKLCLGKGTINDPERYPRFGGIFSCQSAMDQRKCIRGFSPHVIATIDNCDLTICLRGNRTEVHHIQPPIRPPFLDDKGPSVPQSQHDIPDSIVQGFVGENKWLEMPLKTIAAKVDRSQSNTGKLVKEKLKSWITDELEHVISLIQKNPHDWMDIIREAGHKGVPAKHRNTTSKVRGDASTAPTNANRRSESDED